MSETMKIAINRKHKGKQPAGLTEEQEKAFFRKYNGQFENVDLTVLQLARAISQGYGYTTQHQGYRKAANFIRGQHIGLDFDTEDERSTIDALMADPFIAKHAAIIHTTASHTPEKPRARVLFVLDRPIAVAAKYTLLATALLDRYGQADPKTKDACRLFFGAVGCTTVCKDNVLTLEAAAAEIVKPYRATISPPEKSPGPRLVAASNGIPPELLKSHSEALLDRVRRAPDGEKYYTLRDISRTFGGYVAGGYYDENDVRSWLKAAIGSRRATVKSMTSAYKTIDEGLTFGQQSPLFFAASQMQDVKPSDQRLVITPDPSWRDAVFAGAAD